MPKLSPEARARFDDQLTVLLAIRTESHENNALLKTFLQDLDEQLKASSDAEMAKEVLSLLYCQDNPQRSLGHVILLWSSKSRRSFYVKLLEKCFEYEPGQTMQLLLQKDQHGRSFGYRIANACFETAVEADYKKFMQHCFEKLKNSNDLKIVRSILDLLSEQDSSKKSFVRGISALSPASALDCIVWFKKCIGLGLGEKLLGFLQQQDRNGRNFGHALVKRTESQQEVALAYIDLLRGLSEVRNIADLLLQKDTFKEWTLEQFIACSQTPTVMIAYGLLLKEVGLIPASNSAACVQPPSDSQGVTSAVTRRQNDGRVAIADRVRCVIS